MYRGLQNCYLDFYCCCLGYVLGLSLVSVPFFLKTFPYST